MRRRVLARLAVALVLAMTTWFSASAVIPQLREQWHLSSQSASWLTIAVQLGFVAGALVSAATNLADVVPARVVILGGAAGAAGVNALLLLAHGLTLAVPLRFATGFFLVGVYPSALKLMATWFRAGRGLALGVLVGALTIGSATPHLVDGLGGLSPHVVIVVTSVLTLGGGVLAYAGTSDGPYPFPSAGFAPRHALGVFRNRGVRLASLGYFGHMWELYAVWAWFAVFFAEGAGASRRGAAYAAFAVIAAGGAGCVAGGWLADRFGRERTTMGMMAVSGACALAIGPLLRAPLAVVLAVGVVWGFAVVADSAQFSALVTEHADQSYVGTALTMQLAVGFTITVSTIWLVPVLASSLGWRWAFAFLAPGPLVGIAAMQRLRAGT